MCYFWGMKYISRAFKYFISLAVILCLVLAALAAAGIIESDISTMFVNGYDSLWQIALMMAAIAAIYPLFGYGKRSLLLPGDDSEALSALLPVMEAKGYRKEEGLSFVQRSAAARILRLWEDRITFTRTATGFDVEGRLKDVVKIISAFS